MHGRGKRESARERKAQAGMRRATDLVVLVIRAGHHERFNASWAHEAITAPFSLAATGNAMQKSTS
jgi:hypothetical protein